MTGDNVQRRSGSIADLPIMVRTDGEAHFNESTTQGRRKVCSTNTRNKCGKCNVRLHFADGKECFNIYQLLDPREIPLQRMKNARCAEKDQRWRQNEETRLITDRCLVQRKVLYGAYLKDVSMTQRIFSQMPSSLVHL